MALTRPSREGRTGEGAQTRAGREAGGDGVSRQSTGCCQGSETTPCGPGMLRGRHRAFLKSHELYSTKSVCAQITWAVRGPGRAHRLCQKGVTEPEGRVGGKGAALTSEGSGDTRQSPAEGQSTKHQTALLETTQPPKTRSHSRQEPAEPRHGARAGTLEREVGARWTRKNPEEAVGFRVSRDL